MKRIQLSQKNLVWLVLALIIIFGFVVYTRNQTNGELISITSTSTDSVASSTGSQRPSVPSGTKPQNDGWFGYANSEYNFSLRYPSYVKPQGFFTSFHELGSNWRVNAAANNQGKAIVSFPIYRIDQGGVATGKMYPLFYVTELRVGVSPNVKECYSIDPGYTDQKVSNVTINGITFKRFSFQDAAMMKTVQGESYRTIHNNMCYVLEQVRNWTTYKDDSMKPGLTQATLDGYYNTAADIAKTFTFTK